MKLVHDGYGDDDDDGGDDDDDDIVMLRGTTFPSRLRRVGGCQMAKYKRARCKSHVKKYRF